MYSNLTIEYAAPSNFDDSISVKFKLLDNSVVPLWCERIITAQQQYQIDDPARFYGFNSIEQQTKYAIDTINYHVDVINNFKPVIDRKLQSVSDQDTLNYLHNCFEKYHGLLEKQDTSLFSQAPDIVKKSLCELNISVHRCESVARGAKPRHVVTYFGLPKTLTLETEHYQYFTDMYSFGTVYLNYVEIGKTLEDLARDQDTYISDDAFKPFRFYSADFTVLYYDSNVKSVLDFRDILKRFYNSKRNFFMDRGLFDGHPYLTSGKIPLAKLETDISLDDISNRQFVKSVILK